MTDLNTFRNFQAPAQSLQGKIIVITGAGDGIGKCAAMTFAQHGATVILLGRTMAKLEAVYDAIESAGYPQAAIFPINLESAIEQDYQQLKSALIEAFGDHIDGLLLNAGEIGPMSPIDSYRVADWQMLLQINVTAPFMLTRALLPLLQQSTDGRIVFTSAATALKGKAYWGAYSVSKAAAENLMEVLADELEHSRVRVNAIDPGRVRTLMRAAAYPAEDPATIPLPETIMNRYLYLFGEAGREYHGEHLIAQEAG